MKKILNILVGIFALTALNACSFSSGLGLNEQASVHIADELPENPLLLSVITCSIQPKDSLMASLYGNNLAFNYARDHSDRQYPAGSILYEVTWQQQADEQWIGANIPKQILSVERLEYDAKGHPIYSLYKGKPLRKAQAIDEAVRIAIISEQKIAVSP